MASVSGSPERDRPAGFGRVPACAPEGGLREGGSEAVRLSIEAAVEHDPRYAEGLELRVVPRQPDAAVQPDVRLEEVERLRRRERRVAVGVLARRLQLVVVVDA